MSLSLGPFNLLPSGKTGDWKKKKIGTILLSIFHLPCIQIQGKFHFAVSQFLAFRLQQFYAYITTA